ncbi:phenol degradation protein meta [Nordella sp. HKS 07]|uniref:SphA family protein n=1 Tax=Nordella sp. HKS 07 TaxID=2712222 RepID=UPI0013E1C0B7|nr:transporter [Nordella sp. HKS 07]QIG49016.1 phenol degradation protein meta [Nordella sp. HKS 07]
MAWRNSTRRHAAALRWRTAGRTGVGRLAVSISLVALATTSQTARADEGGVSFWVPGQYASFAAVAPTPGFSLPMLSYYYSGNADGDVELDRGHTVSFGVDADFFGQFIAPTYTPDTTIVGARPSFSVTFFPGWNQTSADVRVGPLSASRTDEITGFGDLYPTAQLFWNQGVHNWMAYVTGGIPVGDYDPDRLANLGMGHAAIDAGGAYTYLNTETGWEFSATAGLTYNFENPDTDYTSGIDSHLDVGTSRFLNEQLFVGAVGYAYVQLTPDEGQRAALGDFESRTFALGPQVGYNFTMDEVPIYTNLRGYYEFDVENRTEGGSVFLTIDLPISALAKAKDQ